MKLVRGSWCSWETVSYLLLKIWEHAEFEFVVVVIVVITRSLVIILIKIGPMARTLLLAQVHHTHYGFRKQTKLGNKISYAYRTRTKKNMQMRGEEEEERRAYYSVYTERDKQRKGRRKEGKRYMFHI